MGRVWPCRCHRTVRASGVSGKRCDLCCRERSRKRLRHEKTPLAVVGVNSLRPKSIRSSDPPKVVPKTQSQKRSLLAQKVSI